MVKKTQDRLLEFQEFTEIEGFSRFRLNKYYLNIVILSLAAKHLLAVLCREGDFLIN